MKKFIILLLLYSYGLFAQTIDDLKKSDTIYFYFSANESQKKNIFYINNITNDTVLNYSYYVRENVFLKFKYRKHKDFDDLDAGIETYKEYHKKRFLRKNKRQIVDIDFLNNLKLNTYEFRSVLHRKKLFLIDENDKKGREFLIREVFISMFDAPTCVDTGDIKIFTVRDIPPFYYETRNKDEFYIFLKPKKGDGNKNLYVLFESSNTTDKNSYEYATLNESERSEPKIQEQYTFKLNIKDQTVFFQLTNKRKQKMKLSKIDDLFSGKYNTISQEKLNTLSEKQLEDLFSTVKNIYVVENFYNSDFVMPKLVKITANVNDFAEKNKE